MYTMRRKNKYFLTFLIICICFIAFINDVDLIWIISPSITAESVQISCYDNISANNFPSILNENVPKNTSLFFVETSCHYKYLRLTVRQACAIESAALLNPNSSVYVMIPSPLSKSELIDSHVNILLSYSNIKIRHINMEAYFIDTPLEKWYEDGKLKSSKWPRSHASDILRYTTLWKFGGTYIDLDVILLKTFQGLTNFAGAESSRHVAAGFVSITHGHPMADLVVTEIRDRFKGYFWGHNGPLAITRALRTFCAVYDVSEMTKERCHGFTVYPPKIFYPLYWTEWKKYFVKKKEEADEVMFKFNESLAIHVWNKFSHFEPVIVGSGQPYDRIAAAFCPKVYSTLGGQGNFICESF